jgi:SPP1 family holin|nr:MAG TPA: holin [Caudoviricetes sp.]DAR24690.1 MAG TPA: holin [Caudoviricetes sp.]
MKVNKETIARTVVLFVALLNTVLNACGKNPLPFSDDEVYTGVSAVVATVAAVWAWWKNNSFTAAAVKADEVLKIEKAEGGTEDEGEQ